MRNRMHKVCMSRARQPCGAQPVQPVIEETYLLTRRWQAASGSRRRARFDAKQS
ncbi:MAG: hypothetical protein PPHERAN_0704 [uncultured Paraburkholderia sp.]|nr:MAG: hypothetical protein PPHERAN_0704 [uncultured Paraburkholderia sp.]